DDVGALMAERLSDAFDLDHDRLRANLCRESLRAMPAAAGHGTSRTSLRHPGARYGSPCGRPEQRPGPVRHGSPVAMAARRRIPRRRGATLDCGWQREDPPATGMVGYLGRPTGRLAARVGA